ncbi:DUF1289 domain-containing protein [Sulfuriferula nivalis]|uniref:DUF1289 domain-containing protein n=1 Tax=Sulfuriferula nivalis TaxID=2675298 RepID=UPI001389C1FB|nr:DUF1289 domain-containing protein [Sulfuriferula nivalis]
MPSSTIPSPCIRNCCLNEEDVCLGCFRHIDEIVNWGAAGDDERRQVLLNTVQRRNAYQLKYPDSAWMYARVINPDIE